MYAHAHQAVGEIATGSTRSPAAVPTAERITPPASICTAASANGLAGTGSRVLANVPLAQPTAASSTNHDPHHADPTVPPEPAEGPASSMIARPVTPTATPPIVAGRGRSPVSA